MAMIPALIAGLVRPSLLKGLFGRGKKVNNKRAAKML